MSKKHLKSVVLIIVLNEEFSSQFYILYTTAQKAKIINNAWYFVENFQPKKKLETVDIHQHY